MSNKETITIDQVGPFGVRMDKTWYNPGRKSGVAPNDFKEGVTYEVMTSEYSKKDGSKGRNIDALIKEVVGNDGASAPKATTSNGGEMKMTAKSFGGYDSPEKNERILRQGVYQAVVQSPALASFVLKKEDFAAVVTEWAEALVKKVRGE